MSEENDLPEGWVQTTLGSVVAINPRVDVSALSDSTLVSFIPMAAVEARTGRIDSSAQRRLDEVRRGFTAFQEGDILFAKITPCMENGKSAVAQSLSSKIGFGSTEFHVLRPDEGIVPQLLYYYISQESFRQTARTYMTGSAGQLRVPAVFLADASYPLAPTNEQSRIVAAIEQQFTRLDAGVGALQRARIKLKRYRAAVLKAAVEGKLTEAWRAEYPTTEPASMLLERILNERRAKWEADLRTKGKDPAKVRYVEPAAPDMEGLPELAEGWCWASFTQISERVTVGHVGPMKDEYLDDGIPFLRGQNVRPNQFDPDGLKYISNEFHHLLAKSALEPGDILVVRSGAVGTACVMPDTYKEANCSDLVIVKRPIQVNPRYAVYYMNSTAQDRVRAKQVGIALTHFNTQSMAAMPLPLAPLAEQEQIVTEVERRLSVISQLETAVEANLKRTERLRQSILSEAFAGRLVPQDPNDEPASVLLERICSERGSRERKNGTGVSKGNKGRTVKVPEPGVLDVMGTEQVELWENVGG